MEKTIKIFTTGGTIDKSYDEGEGVLSNRNSVIRLKLLKKLRLPHTEIIIESLFSKDSLDMDDQDRQIVLKAVQDHLLQTSPDIPVVILHGTDTLHLTAQCLMEKLKNIDRPIVFTGAMVPSTMEGSDAWQNVAEALLACKMMGAGVYLAFHGEIYEAPHFQKNRDKRTFEAIKIKP